MAPLDQSRQYLAELLGEKRSIGYEKRLNLRGGNSRHDRKDENGRDVGQRDGKSNDGDHKGDRNGDGNDRKEQEKNNNNPNSPEFDTFTAAAVSTPPEATTTALLSAEESPISNTAIPFIPINQPESDADPTSEVLSTPTATLTATTESLTLPTTPEPTFSGPTFEPEPTKSPVTSVFFPTTSAIPLTTSTETPIQTTFISSSLSSSTASSTSILVTTSISATPVVTSITATTTVVVLATSSSQRKDDKPHDHNNATITASAEADTSGGNGTHFSVHKHHGGGQRLSPQAEHALIAIGVIAAFIILGFLVYLFVRVRKINLSEKFEDFLDRYPRFERMLSVIPVIGKRRRWSRGSSSTAWDKDAFESSTISSQKSKDAFYVPESGLDEKSKLPSGANIKSARSTVDFSEKPILSYGMTNPATPLHIANPSATMSFYNVQTPASAYVPNAARMSELSSLSSGFGDAQIDVPESGPTTTYNGTINSNAATVNTIQPYRQSFMQRASRAFAEPLTSRFSWTTANQSDTSGGNSQRDTMYTTTSEDSAPRFRTIHSWVNQQSNRVEKGKAARVPSMPPLPPSQRHLKRGSEEPAFRHHPGDEVNIGEPKRIASAILDRKLGAGA